MSFNERYTCTYTQNMDNIPDTACTVIYTHNSSEVHIHTCIIDIFAFQMYSS